MGYKFAIVTGIDTYGFEASALIRVSVKGTEELASRYRGRPWRAHTRAMMVRLDRRWVAKFPRRTISQEEACMILFECRT